MRWLDNKIDRFMDENKDLVEAVRVTNAEDAVLLRGLQAEIIALLQETNALLEEIRDLLALNA